MKDEQTPSGGDFVRDLGEAILANPVPSALIGMGLAWLFTGGRSSAKASFGWAKDSMTHFRSKDDGEPARRIGRSFDDLAGQSLGDRSAVARKASAAAYGLAAATPQFFASAQANLADLMRRQPLMLGAVGLAVGAGIAASLRPTAAEADLLGEASTNVQGRAREFAAAAVERTARLADDITTAIGQEARAQELTPDSIQQSAREASRKVESVIDRSAERLRSRIN
jgi:hypothetical protein